jgi:SAM-dependent methyltransferase
MFKCTTSSYEKLYSRWLENPGSLLDLASYDPKRDRLIDLCGGTGAVSLEAVRRGAIHTPVLIDLNPRCQDTRRVKQVAGDVQDIEAYVHLKKADVCVIRQSLGYLDLNKVFGLVRKALEPGGRLAFNAFSRPRWKVSTYRHENRRHFEISAFFGKKVFHIQASPSIGADVSVFRHHSKDEIREALKSFSSCSISDDGKSLRVFATK